MRGRSLRKEKSRRVFFIIAVLAGIIGIGLLLPKVFQAVATVVTAPAHNLNEWLETSEDFIPALVRDRSTLVSEIERLEQELVVTQGSALTFRRLEEENQRLRSLLNTATGTRIAAGVIARPGELPYDVMMIDQGQRSGVTELAPVYVGKDQIIGIVSDVSPNHSFVRLFTSPGIELTGFISGPDVVATLEGVGGGVARMRVPQGIPLTLGDIVYAPGVEPGLFGRLDFIENRPSQPEQFGYISLPVPTNSLHLVAVGTAPIAPSSLEVVDANVAEIVANRLLIEESHTVSFEELLATSTPTTTSESEQ